MTFTFIAKSSREFLCLSWRLSRCCQLKNIIWLFQVKRNPHGSDWRLYGLSTQFIVIGEGPGWTFNTPGHWHTSSRFCRAHGDVSFGLRPWVTWGKESRTDGLPLIFSFLLDGLKILGDHQQHGSLIFFHLYEIVMSGIFNFFHNSSKLHEFSRTLRVPLDLIRIKRDQKICCLLWINKARVKEKTYTWVSVWWG
jgi:hypothetical protein